MSAAVQILSGGPALHPSFRRGIHGGLGYVPGVVPLGSPLTDILSVAASAANSPADALRQIVKGIKIETAYLPTIDINDPFGPPGQDFASQQLISPALKLLKPKISFTLGNNLSVAPIMPYGDPGPTKWDTVATGFTVLLIAGGGLGLITLFGAFRAYKKRKRRKGK